MASSFNVLSTNTIKAIRIEKRLHQRLVSYPGLVGKVNHIYRNGFDLLVRDVGITHLREGKWLQAPFGIVLDKPIERWIKNVNLREGDVFYRNGEVFCRETDPKCCIDLHPIMVVNLKRKLFTSPPSRNILMRLILSLTEEISKNGKFEGLGSIVVLVKTEMSDGKIDIGSTFNHWSQHALPHVSKLMESTLTEDLALFEEAWISLSGLGPGLTPAGDDFLVGFLAAHKLFSSSFSKKMENGQVKTRLKEEIRSKTVPIAYQFLEYALDGIFSETLILVFSDLLLQRWHRGSTVPLFSGENGAKAIRHFLDWGHSSGTDTLTGAVIGLWTMAQITQN